MKPESHSINHMSIERLSWENAENKLKRVSIIYYNYQFVINHLKDFESILLILRFLFNKTLN